MGQRGAAAAFMPSRFVFPGGAVDQEDADVLLAGLPVSNCLRTLVAASDGPSASVLCAAAIRELWEETGLMMGQTGAWKTPPQAWSGFAAQGIVPDATGLRFIFRAITPPGRPRRFDARFFLAHADSVTGDSHTFTAASGELSGLHWVTIDAARRLPLPFITTVVLAEVAHLLGGKDQSAGVPFFDNSTNRPAFRRLI